jgi:MFS family permease
MTGHSPYAGTRTAAAPRSPWAHVLRAAAALAAAMGVGRFVFTPILPLMHEQAGLSASGGAHLATANYAGYLVGALLGTAAPAVVRSRTLLRAALVTLTATLAAMPVAGGIAAWLVLRLLAGVASALVFVIAVSSLHSRLRQEPDHVPGWAFGGVGAGIALSGLLVLVLRSAADWRAAWWASAALGAVLTAVSWRLEPEPPPAPGPAPVRAARGRRGGVRTGRVRTALRRTARAEGAGAGGAGAGAHRAFGVLLVSYALEGVGYIVAGTFLVAAVEQGSPGWLGSGAWVVVGLAAVPSAAVWTGLGRRWSRPGLLCAALVVQAAGIALPALVGGVGAALGSAVLFGGTFIGVSTLALAVGAQLRFPRAVALLTAGYSVGQILGPLVVTPLLRHGYHQALLAAAAVVVVSAAGAAALRVGFPRDVPAARQDPQARRAAPGGAVADLDRGGV